MRILPIGYRRLMRSLERHLANQVEHREDKAIAAVSASLGKPLKQHQSRTEPMPYRHSITAAFVALAAALAGLSWWCP